MNAPASFGTFDLNKLRLIEPNKAKRISLITKAGIIKPLRNLARNNPCDFVFGIDTKNGSDQCVCHVNKEGIQCVARKIFPVKGEEANEWISNVEDAGIEHRVTEIQGTRFLLAACYDMFGAEVLENSESDRIKNILCLSKNGKMYRRGNKEFDELKHEFISYWRESVSSSDAGIACIHDFTKEGPRSGMSSWQVAGMSRQIQYLRRKMIFGAAHYVEERKFNPRTSFLASGRSLKKGLVISKISRDGQALVRVWDVKL